MAFVISELASLLEFLVEQECLDCQTGRCSRALDVIEHGLERVQWFSSPVDSDLTEQAILDRVVFGVACWIVADHNGDAQFIGKKLKFMFPQPEATIVATAGIA